MTMIAHLLLLSAIALNGVVGGDLRARAFFDANNVKVGDPLVLTIDFLGEADFKALHPPALAKLLDRKDWKLDDASAKTETYRDARRLTYRVRPMRPGVLWFPSLAFEYANEKGVRQVVRANEIPVHAKAGAQVVVAEMDAVGDGKPQPDALVTNPGVALDDDAAFAWRKACAKPSVQAFAAFDFPAARLNEARQSILDGNWAHALKIYSRLEWVTGQTPTIERGILAALAVRSDSPNVELPVWRSVGRPILRHDWKGRLGIVGGVVAAVALVFWLLGRGLRALACLALALALPFGAAGQGLFEQMEEQMRRMQRHAQQMMGGGFNMGFGFEEEPHEPIAITASFAPDRKEIHVGESFEFLVSIELPRTASVSQLQLTPSETFGMTVTGRVRNLPDGTTANVSNVVKRLGVPVRYDVPFKGPVAFRVNGMVTGRQTRHGGRFSFTFSNSFTSETDPILVEILPLAAAGQPADFRGIVSEGLRLAEFPDLLTPETNDVICLTYRLVAKGYVPKEFLPEGAAFEIARAEDGTIDYRRFFVADGTAATPRVSVVYYDPREKKYKRAQAGGTPLKYVPTR